MSKIKKGDLVEIVYSCCQGFREEFIIFCVEGIHHVENTTCRSCGRPILPGNQAFTDSGNPAGAISFPVSWLRKIEPPSQFQSRETVVPWDQCDWQPEKVRV